MPFATTHISRCNSGFLFELPETALPVIRTTLSVAILYLHSSHDVNAVMAIVQCEGKRLIIEVSDEEAKNLHPGDTVQIVKIDVQNASLQIEQITDQVLRDFAADIDCLKDK